jgi:hypothetical protein
MSSFESLCFLLKIYEIKARKNFDFKFSDTLIKPLLKILFLQCVDWLLL